MLNINSIHDLKITHRHWEEALATSFTLLISVPPGDVVCITGPSRVGKTRLVLELNKLLVGENGVNETGFMPTVVVEAVNSGPNGSFSTKAFILRMLDALKHPVYSSTDNEWGANPASHKVQRATEAELRRALENALRARRVKYLFIDEAQHARYASKDAQGAFAVMDSWKCLAQSVGVVLVIVGAYPILQIIRNSPHLVGRKHQVHLPRYRFENADLKEFAAILMAYRAHLDLCPSLGDLVKHVLLFHEGTEGCIGLLRAWLLRAQARARALGGQVSMNDLVQTRLSDDDLLAVGREISEGEYLLSSTSESGRNPAQEEQTEKIPRGAGKPKPFQKKPVRRKPGHRTTPAG